MPRTPGSSKTSSNRKETKKVKNVVKRPRQAIMVDITMSDDDSSSDADTKPKIVKKQRAIAAWDDMDDDEDDSSSSDAENKAAVPDEDFDDLFDVRPGGGGDGKMSPPLLTEDDKKTMEIDDEDVIEDEAVVRNLGSPETPCTMVATISHLPRVLNVLSMLKTYKEISEVNLCFHRREDGTPLLSLITGDIHKHPAFCATSVIHDLKVSVDSESTARSTWEKLYLLLEPSETIDSDARRMSWTPDDDDPCIVRVSTADLFTAWETMLELSGNESMFVKHEKGKSQLTFVCYHSDRHRVQTSIGVLFDSAPINFGLLAFRAVVEKSDITTIGLGTEDQVGNSTASMLNNLLKTIKNGDMEVRLRMGVMNGRTSMCLIGQSLNISHDYAPSAFDASRDEMFVLASSDRGVGVRHGVQFVAPLFKDIIHGTTSCILLPTSLFGSTPCNEPAIFVHGPQELGSHAGSTQMLCFLRRSVDSDVV